MRKPIRLALGLAIATFVGCAWAHQESPSAAQNPQAWDGSPDSSRQSRYRVVAGTRGMVVSDDREASEWGAEILREGGNAVDAAVATGFALAVTRPHFASIGGGGFMIYCPHSAPKCVALDYREAAPAAAKRDMYVHDGEANTELSQSGALASGIPGVTAGLLTALEKFGTLPRMKLLTRPIRLAREGFPFTVYGERTALERWKDMNSEAKHILGCGSRPCAPGTLICQPDLARTLEAISREGQDGFYQGEVARRIVDGIRHAGGIFTLADLASYAPKFREPLYGNYRGMQLVLMPPPSSGGTLLLQLFGYAERAEKSGAFIDGFGSARSIHALAYGMDLAFADRADILGDPDFVPGLKSTTLPKILSPGYLDRRWQSFEPRHWKPVAGSGLPETPEGRHTTHFSVIDREGNAVAITTTVNTDYGSAFVPPGTGVVMNNEMDDFSIEPGVPNAFGLVGGEANAIAPHKRPLSSMTPTIVRDAKNETRIVIGAAGGPRIITSTFLSLFNRLRFGMSLPDAVAAPRFHEQWRPEYLSLERFGFGYETRAELRDFGYELREVTSLAKVHGLERFPNGRVWGAPDFRGEGAAEAE